MLSQDDYKRLQEIQKTDPQIYDFIFHMAQNALEAVSQGCHDIRNCVALISSYEQLFSMEHPEVLDSNYYRKLELNTVKTLDLLNRIAEYRYSFRTGTGDVETLNLYDLVRDVVEECKEKVETDKEIFVCIGPKEKKDRMLVNIEGQEIKKALREVVTNALEACNEFIYTPEIMPCVDVVITFADPWIEISVQDNAGGYPEEMLLHGWTPFKTQKQGHYGLGMAIACETVRRLGGDVKVETINQGAKVTLMIPGK